MRWSDAALLAGALALSGGAAAADAACDGKVVASLGQQLGIPALQGTNAKRRIVAQACKDWPAKAGGTPGRAL
jgi:hypothetical protein